MAVLGAGLSGLSTSFHLGHPDDAVVYEAKDYYGGHGHSEYKQGFTWDDGPHISFTSNAYIKELFAELVDDEYEDLDVKAVNWFEGHWIDHPAQTSLWQVPEPLRTQCVESFLETAAQQHEPPKNYQEWLHQAFGPVFAETFPAKYTRKYWTCEPANLDVDWIGMRILRPEAADVVAGAKGPLPESMYYVNTRSARYPSKGGFGNYTHKLANGADIRYGMRLEGHNFGDRTLRFADGSEVGYQRLVSTINLPFLIECSDDAPDDVREAARTLRSSMFYRVDFAVSHEARRPELWYYVYDEDKLSVRISVFERFAASNAPEGRTGIQVEVYGSVWRPMPDDPREVQRRVRDELIEFGLIDDPGSVLYSDIRLVRTGQIIYDLHRREALRTVNAYLDRVGVLRVGRYSEWKYLMSDTCVLGGRRAAQQLLGKDDDTDWSGVAINVDDTPDDKRGS
ncbi:MAG: NAD(P)/FAD-dependent oxidoreductase [Acidimicrobiia bacterium]